MLYTGIVNHVKSVQFLCISVSVRIIAEALSGSSPCPAVLKGFQAALGRLLWEELVWGLARLPGMALNSSVERLTS